MTGPQDALGKSGIRPKIFRGGPASDYRLGIGENSTLLSEHIPTGLKVPAVEVDTLLAAASKVAKLDRSGKAALAAGATAATVVTVYSLVKSRQARKENAALRAEVAQLRNGEVGASESTETAVSRDTEEVLTVVEVGPILLSEPSAPRILDPTAVRPLVIVGEWTKTAPADSPADRRSTPSPGDPAPSDDWHRHSATDADQVGEAVGAYDVPTAVGIDVAVEASANSRSDEIAITTKVDWAQTVESQVEAARNEQLQGKAADGIDRLTRLLLFLDEIPGKQGSPLYPAITVEPLIALVELSAQPPQEGGGAATSTTDWLTRLSGHATNTDDEAIRHRVEELLSRIDA